MNYTKSCSDSLLFLQMDSGGCGAVRLQRKSSQEFKVSAAGQIAMFFVQGLGYKLTIKVAFLNRTKTYADRRIIFADGL